MVRSLQEQAVFEAPTMKSLVSSTVPRSNTSSRRSSRPVTPWKTVTSVPTTPLACSMVRAATSSTSYP